MRLDVSDVQFWIWRCCSVVCLHFSFIFLEIGHLQTSDLKSDVSSPPLLSPYFEISPFSTLQTSLFKIKRFFDGDVWFEIWHWSQISTRGDVRAQKKWEKGGKRLTVIRGNSGPTPLARGWLQGLKASPLSARPYTMCHIPKSRTTCSTRCNVRTRMKLRGHVKCDIHN